MPVAAREDRIRRFRVVGRSADALTLRRHVERTFARHELRPAGLSPTAIVCVRTVRIPQPIGSGAWADTLDREMRRVVAGAVRPFHQTVPAGATAVVFDDEAELMTCLARDWRRGEGGAWWWRALVGQDLSEDAVIGAFVRALPAVPAAFERLAASGIARDVVDGLSTTSCVRLLHCLAAAFAVPDVDGAFAADRDPIRRRIGNLPALSPRQQRRIEAAVLLPPGQGLRDMALPQRRLIATALMLDRDAALARTPGIVAAISRGWWPETGTPLTAVAPDHTSPVSGERVAPARLSTPPGAAMTPAPLVQTARAPAFRLSPPSLVAGVTRVSDDSRQPPHQHRPVFVDASDRDSLVSGPADRRPQREKEELARPMSPAMTWVASEFAGVFYLINVALHLELYGDFTQPARPGLALPIGDFLALVGERVCGPSLRSDVLWGLLASLADRNRDDPPGADVTPPDGMTLEAWIDHMTRLLAERTAAALGVEPELALPFLCVRAGRVALSPTRLDVEFTLADHPLVLRLAGLDRNPGWVPAAGRSVEFHFR